MKALIAFLLMVWLAGGGAAQEQEKPQSHDRQSKQEAPAQPLIHPNFSTEGPIVLSDTQGFVFGPYLARIVSVVRRNWYAVIPGAARSGEKGRVAIVFEILKDGSVPQFRVEASSGSEPLDRAALAAIRTSAPFPSLPAEFAGNHLVVEFVFLYNPAASEGPASNGPGYGGGIGSGAGGGTRGGGLVDKSPHQAGGNYAEPTAIYRPLPEYTRQARKAKVEGIVALRFTVDAQGKVSDIQVTKSLGLGLDEKTVQAVSKWKFHPATRDGVPVPTPMSVAFRFGPSYRTPQEDAQAFSAAGFKSAERAAEAGPTSALAPQNPPAPAGTDGKDFGKGAYRVGEGVSAPVPTYEPQPSYSDQARRAKLNGTVVLQIVVDAQGNVSDVRVQKSLGKGLDEKAIEAVSKWKFHPATRGGVPVPVILSVEFAFSLI